MKSRTIYLTVHGGLGNQLYQLLFARVLQKTGNHKLLVYDLTARYRVKRQLSKIFSEYERTNGDFFVKLRLGKALEKILRRSVVLKLPGKFYLDGYFQRPPLRLLDTHKEIFFSVIEELRLELINDALHEPYCTGGVVVHVRLTDFNRTRSESLASAVNYLKFFKNCSHFVVTDDEALVSSLIATTAEFRRLKLIRTSTRNDIELLNLLSVFSEIYTNGSSLSMWAAVLGRRRLYSSNGYHQWYFDSVSAFWD